jgi:RHS repeat-associated protein
MSPIRAADPSDDLADLVLMGVRLYNPATGRFLSVDPVVGGNANPYTYPLDPINGYDPTGMMTVLNDNDTNPPPSHAPSHTVKTTTHSTRRSSHPHLPSGHIHSVAYPPTPDSEHKSINKGKLAKKAGKAAEKQGAGFAFGYGVRLTCVAGATYFTEGAALVGGAGAVACTAVGAAAGFAFKQVLWR